MDSGYAELTIVLPSGKSVALRLKPEEFERPFSEFCVRYFEPAYLCLQREMGTDGQRS